MRSDFSIAIIKLAFFAAIALALVNDAGSVIYGHYRIGEETKSVAEEARRNFNLNGRSPQLAMAAAQTKAELDGAVLTGFQITRDAVRVSVEIPPKTTWVIHRVSSFAPYLSAVGQLDLPLAGN